MKVMPASEKIASMADGKVGLSLSLSAAVS